MKICYLNRHLQDNTGVGAFCLSLTRSIVGIRSDVSYNVLTGEDILSGGFFGLVFNFFKIRRFFRQYDIIHALDAWPYGVIAAFFSLGLKKRVLITAVGTGAVEPLYHTLKKQLLIWAYRNAHRVVAVSSNTRSEILKVVPDLKIDVINHGVDVSKFPASADPLRQSFSEIENLRPYILSVGWLKPRKGLIYSLRAFALIAPKFQGLRYMIVGEGLEYENLVAESIRLGVHDKVIILKKVSEEYLASLYKGAELFLLLPQSDSKDIEGFGLVFLEAAACGLPVVGTYKSGAADAIWEGHNGFLVEPRDPQAAAEAVLKILTDHTLRNEFSRNSILFAQKMSWDKAARLYLDVYESQIKQKQT
ncbi:MAG: glycosyltransferase family 4 protein [Parcubacteria group bacterium]|nr:glycosyltransferase family 4 protein [Parcubacteria group bacterium]